MKKKKNVFLRLALVLLVATTICANLFAGNTTVAYYAAQATGTGNAQIAKFDVLVNDKILAAGMASGGEVFNSGTLNLFNTIEEWTGVASTDGTAGQMDVQVVNASGVNTKMAPGTRGSLGVKITNKSDVAISYTITVKTGTVALSTSAPKLQFDDGNGGAYTAAAVPSSNATLATVTGTLAVGSTSAQEATKTIKWQWPFNDGSSAGTYPVNADLDTPVGITPGNYTIPVTVTVDVAQID